MRLIANAKLNLFLHLNGKREDGYHVLESLVGFTAFGDVLIIQPSDIMRYHIEGPFAPALPADEINLIEKAANALIALGAECSPVSITLEKHIPVSAGLGGGSVDAAAVLRALADYWQIRLDHDFARRIALALGADVPVAYMNQPALMRGIGEMLEPLAHPLPPMGVLLVNSGHPVPTAQVFGQYAGRSWRPPLTEAVPSHASAQAWAQWLKAYTHNDLQEPASIISPMIHDVLDALQSAPGALLARMSGSGGTCFALFGSEAEASTAASWLHSKQTNWWVMPTVLREI